MSTTIEGTIKKSMMGMGAWALETSGGKSYEIHKGAPDGLLVNGQKVRVKGEIREDVMTIAMIGPVLEVKSFEAMS